MVRSDLVARISEDYPALSLSDDEKVVDLFFDSIVDQLKKGGRIELRGFGAFTARSYEARTGRNPRTGEAVDVSAKARAHFKPGKAMLERLNSRP